MFKEMVSHTFLFDSSSFWFSLFPTSLDENELSRGVKPLWILLYSMDIISLCLKGSFWMKAQMLSSLGKTYQDSILWGICGQYRDWKGKSGLCGRSCRLGEAAEISNRPAIEFNSLLTWMMLKDNRFEISIKLPNNLGVSFHQLVSRRVYLTYKVHNKLGIPKN